MTPDRRTILALFSLAFGIRILYAILAGADPDILSNPHTYDFQIARKITEGVNWWSQPISPRAPGYQLMLAVIFSIGGVRWWLVAIAQAVFSGVIAFVLYRIGEKHLGRMVGLAAAIWFAIDVHQAHYSSMVARDATVGMLVAFVCYLVIRYANNVRGTMWTAVVYCILVHFDPGYLLFLPVLALYSLFYTSRHPLLRVQYTFLLLGTVVLLLAPWTIRNLRVYGDPIPVALEATKYLHPVEFASAHSEGAAGAGTNAVSRPGFWRNSLEYWRVMRLRETMQAAPDGLGKRVPPWSLRHNLSSLVIYGLLIPFFLWGVWISVRSRNRAGVTLTVAVAGMYLIAAFYGGSPRTRVPAEPLIILLAFYGINDLYCRYRAHKLADARAGATAALAPKADPE